MDPTSNANRQAPTSTLLMNPNISTPSSADVLRDMANPVLDAHRTAIANGTSSSGGSQQYSAHPGTTGTTVSTTGGTGAGGYSHEAGSATQHSGSNPPATSTGSAPAGSSYTGTPGVRNPDGSDPSSTAQQQQQQQQQQQGGGEEPGVGEKRKIENAVISKEKYEELLSMQQELKKLKSENEANQKEIEEWRSLRGLAGASKASEIAARVASARQREIQEFKNAVDEALPVIEERYRKSGSSQQEYLRPYLESFREYADHPEKVSLDAMNSAKGFIDLITNTVRERNTQLAEKDAELKSLQARCSAEAERAKEATAQLNTFITTASAKRKTIAPFIPEHHGFDRMPETNTSTAPPSLDQPYQRNMPSAGNPSYGQQQQQNLPANSGTLATDVFSTFAPKKITVRSKDIERPGVIEAMPFHFKPEEHYLNYFPPEERESAQQRAKPAEQFYNAIAQEQTKYRSTTPMNQFFLNIKQEEEKDALRPVSEGVFSRSHMFY